MGNNDHDDDDRKDLTRIEDLSEFLHESNPEIESKLNSFNSESTNIDFTNTNIESGIDVSGLDDLPAMPDTPQNLPPDEMPAFEMSEEESDSSASFTEESPPEVSFEPERDGVAFSNSEFEENTPQFIDESINEENNESSSSINFSDEATYTNLEEVIDFENSDTFNQSVAEDLDNNLTSIEELSSSESSIESDSIVEDQDSYESMSEISHTFVEPEKFEEVKTFAHTFSYGQVSVGGNPPFSLIVRNIKYKEDADSILSLLKEFGIVTDKNLNETKMALDIGSLLIPQISEFAAIVIAHKFRRFDCDIEFGLSEEIHPTKAGESYNKGLTSKESIRQNKIDSFKKVSPQLDISDILVSTTGSLEGYDIVKYLGVQSSLAIVEAEELERLKYVQSTKRSNTQVMSTENDETDSMTAEEAFNDYQQSFDTLFIDLVDQLKQKAFKEHANALLGLNYQMTQLPLNTKDKKQLNFQLVCSATLALVKIK